MKRYGIIGVLLLCLVLVGSVACGALGGDSGATDEQLVKVERGDLMVTVSGSGAIEVANERQLAFGTGGKIDRIYVSEGDEVGKGGALAKLDTSGLELALTQAKLALVQAGVGRDEAEYNLDQLRDVLHASRDRVEIAESALNAAEEQLKAAEQAVAEAQKQLDEATITAPFDGVVASVDADEGDTVSPGMPIVHLIDLTSMELNAEVDEIDIAEMKPGQRVIIEVDALPASLFEGKVKSISQLPKVEAGVVVYEVKIVLDVPPESALRVGMSATADIVINERSNVLLVPDRAIKENSQGNTVVKVMVDDEIEERPVVTGISDGFETEIVEGLKEGELVVRG